MKESTRKQIEALETMRLPELWARFAYVTGKETKAPNRRYLVRAITEAMEARDAENADAAPHGEGAEVIHDDAGDARSADDQAAAGQDDEHADSLTGESPAPEGASDEAAGEHDRHNEAPEPSATHARQPKAAGTRGRFAGMTVADLQARHRELTGRDTASTDAAYLRWRLRQAEKGRIPVGPRSSRRADREAGDFKVLPLRMEAELVTQLDEARERLGLKSRMDLIRRALHAFLLEAGEVRVAEMFAPTAE